MSRYSVTKTYSPERGFSCAFRQWRANSPCRFLHGYALGVQMTLSSDTLDNRNWVYDFGGLAWAKSFIEEAFDHTTCIAADDPALPYFQDMDAQGLIQLRIMPAVGCESFARHVYDALQPHIDAETNGRVRVDSVTVFEHSGNSATYAR